MKAARGIAVLEHAHKLLLGATVALLPLAYGPDVFADKYNVPKLALLLAVVALGAGLRIGLLVLGRSLHPLSLAVPAVAVAISMIASWLPSDHRAWALWGSYARFGGLIPSLAVILFALLLADAFRGRPRPILLSFVGGAAVVGTVAFLQMLFSGEAIGRLNPEAWVTSTVGNSNFTGGYLAAALPVAVAIWLEDGRWSRWAMGSAIPICCGLIFTGAQAAWIAAVAGLLVLLGLRTRSHRPTAGRAVSFVGVVVGCVPALAVFATLAVERAMFVVPSFLATAASRGLLWRDAWDVVWERPILGWGPQHIAIQGPLHRSIENALFLNAIRADDPHSIPLAVLANLGVIGLIALVGTVVWAFRTLAKNWRGSSLAPGIAAALVVYLAQGSVSIEEITSRFTFWMLLGVTAAGSYAVGHQHDARAPSARRWVPALTPVVVGGAVAIAAVTSVAIADRKIVVGLELFGGGEAEQGRIEFQDALGLRSDNEYKRLYAATLGIHAFRVGSDGGPFIEESEKVFEYLDRFPDVQAITLHAEILNQWALIEPSANLRALDIFTRARRLDPYDPFLALSTADAQIQLDRPRDAEATLRPFVQVVFDHYPDYAPNLHEVWSGLAIAQIEQGDLDEGARTLALAENGPGGCRYLIAQRLLRRAQGLPPLPGSLAFRCPPTLLSMLGEESGDQKESALGPTNDV